MNTDSGDSLNSSSAYRFPAEWEPHESTWLAWPHFRGDWPGKFEPIPWVYAEIIRNLARHERVDLIVNSGRAEKRARAVLEQADALRDRVIVWAHGEALWGFAAVVLVRAQSALMGRRGYAVIGGK